MTLEMKEVCERCKATVAAMDDAYICSYECTFCRNCAHELQRICPNCGGELVVRPKRKVSAEENL
jgi:hypothetical protein